jgi:hypothetical protein
MTPPDLVVLHTLRCIGFAILERVADAAGLPEPEVESDLIDLAVAGLVTRLTGQLGGGWGLTEAGRAVDAARIGEELDRAGARPAITSAHQRFAELNPELLDLCTAWQMRSVDGAMVVNDHTDPAYDARVVDLFAEFDARAGAVCADLATALPRFGRYHGRLGDAMARARSGATRFLTDDMASYHSVWFQLHEDLLATLGIPRQ